MAKKQKRSPRKKPSRKTVKKSSPRQPKRSARKVSSRPQKIRYAPLSNSFFVTSIVGFFLSVFFIKQYSLTWAFAFSLIFLMMIIASFLSMKRAPPPQK